jgi:hypothetical protein
MEYLFSRGICEETMRTYKLGYMEKPWMVAPEFQQPAIVMPWMKSGVVVGIRYRFLKPVNGQRVRSAADSDFAGKLFGGQALWISPDSLPAMFMKRRFVLCEGELNAMSIAQDMRDMKCDVLSIGSESQSLTESQIAFAKRYKKLQEMLRLRLLGIFGWLAGAVRRLFPIGLISHWHLHRGTPFIRRTQQPRV